jgi:hypothetical protein
MERENEILQIGERGRECKWRERERRVFKSRSTFG